MRFLESRRKIRWLTRCPKVYRSCLVLKNRKNVFWRLKERREALVRVFQAKKKLDMKLVTFWVFRHRFIMPWALERFRFVDSSRFLYSNNLFCFSNLSRDIAKLNMRCRVVFFQSQFWLERIRSLVREKILILRCNFVNVLSAVKLFLRACYLNSWQAFCFCCQRDFRWPKISVSFLREVNWSFLYRILSQIIRNRIFLLSEIWFRIL